MKKIILFSLIITSSSHAKYFGNKEQAKSQQESQEAKGYAAGCPQVIKDLTEDDAASSFFGVWEGQKRKCTLITGGEKYVSDGYDLDIELASRLQSKLQLSSSSTGKECASGPDGKYNVAKFYYNQARLEAGEKQLIQELGGLARLVPNDVPLTEASHMELKAPVVSSFFPEVKVLAEKIKGCGAPGQDPLNELATAMKEADLIITDLEQTKSALYDARLRVTENNESWTPSQEFITSLETKVRDLEPLANSLKEQYPWLNADAFKAAFATTKTTVLPRDASEAQKTAALLAPYRAGILAQVRVEQKQRTEQLNKYNQASDCLMGRETNKEICESTRVRNIVNSTPTVETGEYRSGRYATISQYMEVQECIHDGKIEQDKITSKSYLDAVGIGTAAITGVLSLGSGLTQIGIGLRNGLSLKNAYTAQALEKLGRAGKTVAALDVAAVTGGIAADQSKCIDERNLALKKLNEPKSDFQCKANELEQALTELRNCETLTTIGLTALPYLGFAAGPLARKLAAMKASTGNALMALEQRAMNSTRALETQLRRNNLDPAKYYSCLNDEKTGCPETGGLSEYLAANKVPADEAASLQRSVRKAIDDRDEIAKFKAAEDLRLLGRRVESSQYNCRRVNAVYTGAFNTNVPCQKLTFKQEVKGEYCGCGDGAKPGQYLFRCAAAISEFMPARQFKDRLALPTENDHKRCFRVTIPAGATCYNGGNGATLSGLGGGSQLMCAVTGISQRGKDRFDEAVKRGEVAPNELPDIPKLPGGLPIERWSPFTENFPSIVTSVNACINRSTRCPKDEVRRIADDYTRAYTARMATYLKISRQAVRERKIRQLEKERTEFRAYFRDLEQNGVPKTPPSK